LTDEDRPATDIGNIPWRRFRARMDNRDRYLPPRRKTGMSAAMEKLFSDPHYKGFVLQDKKRLPARFFARVCGATTTRLRIVRFG
jgi:hypothetical protein